MNETDLKTMYEALTKTSQPFVPMHGVAIIFNNPKNLDPTIYQYINDHAEGMNWDEAAIIIDGDDTHIEFRVYEDE